MRAAGGNHKTLRRYVELWQISTDHFDPHAARRQNGTRGPKPLAEVMVEHSTYSRGQLKQRLYDEGLKERSCELCGQGELWKGRPMSLILDHINGVGNDHRLENLQIVCPNCAATLSTHCGRNKRMVKPRPCAACSRLFQPHKSKQRCCSRACANSRARRGVPCPNRRKVERPPIEQVVREIEADGYRAVARRYGVSDNAIRKWLRWGGVTPPTRTWPNRRR